MSVHWVKEHGGEPRAENVLITCPATTEAGRDACVRTLTAVDPAQMNLLVITYQQSPESVLDVWRERIGEPPSELQIVSADHPIDPAVEGGDEEWSMPTVALSDPGDLTELGIAVQETLQGWAENQNHTVICGGSLTAMSQWVTPGVLERFIRMFLLNRPDVHVHFHVSPDAHYEGLIDGLAESFDRVVEHSPHRTSEDGPDELPDEVLCDIVSHPERRQLLRYLLDVPGLVEVPELVEELRSPTPPAGAETTTENRRDAQLHERTESQRVRVGLLHKHLPKLSDAGIVEHDDDEGTVRLAAHTERVEGALDWRA
jgi:hypothetical protein